jgi:flagellar motor switch protein FliM
MSEDDDKPSTSWESTLPEATSEDLQPSERVLSQSEINTLLGNDHPEKMIGIDALLSNRRVSHERLPMLEVVFERLIRQLTTTLRNFTSDNVEISMHDFTSVRFGDFINSIPSPTLLGVAKAVDWNNFCLMSIGSSLIYTIVDVLLGGRKVESMKRTESRSYTSIERNLMVSMMQLLLIDLSAAFSPIEKVTFQFDRIETNPRFAGIARALDAAVVVTLKIDMDSKGGILQIILPYATLEPVRDSLLQTFMGEKFGQDRIWENHLAGSLWNTDIDIEAILGKTQLTLQEVLEWKAGSQLILKTKPDSQIHIRSGDIDIWKAQIGQRSGNVSIRITESYLKEEEVENHGYSY